MLIISENDNFNETINIINTVVSNIRKTIVSGKQGESALKYYFDGSFLCPVDTILDSIKVYIIYI